MTEQEHNPSRLDGLIPFICSSCQSHKLILIGAWENEIITMCESCGVVASIFINTNPSQPKPEKKEEEKTYYG